MNIFKNLFSKDESVTCITVQLSRDANHICLIDKNKNPTEKDLLILGILFYARIIRVLPTVKEKKDLASTFIIWQTELENGGDMNTIKLLSETYTKIKSSGLSLNSNKNIVLKKTKNETYYLDVDSFHYKTISLAPYLIFDFIWDNVNSENKVKLLDGCSLIAAEHIKNGLSRLSAVSLPNHLIKEY